MKFDPLSRPIATAEKLGELAADRHRFTEKRVLLTGEESVLRTENGKLILFASIRLLVRTCKGVTVSLPAGLEDLTRECQGLLSRLSFAGATHEVRTGTSFNGFDAILSVGTLARADLPWTVVNSHGWLARVSSTATNLLGDCSRPNPIGALGAACLGVSEVFKRLIRLRPDRGKFFDGVSFSLFDYTASVDPGPELPADLPVDLLLAGCGAIGNGIAFLLSSLPISGRVSLIDRQTYGEENLGTCILLEPSGIGHEKAGYLTTNLSTKVSAQGIRDDIQAFERHIGADVTFPKVILGALDNVDARHALQDLWPDLIIDGAISDFGCQVSSHPWNEAVACVRCLFKKPIGKSVREEAMKDTGLSGARLGHPDDVITAADVAEAPLEKRTWLKERIGKPICSVLAETEANRLSTAKQKRGFEPSLPFVACFSACMVVSELIKAITKQGSLVDPRFQMDMLHGPQHGLVLSQFRSSDCACSTRKTNIEKARSLRVSVATPGLGS